MRVLILGGWSPGPLDLVRHHFSQWEFEEPLLPMPPAGWLWCCNPFCILLCLLCGVVPWLLNLAAKAGGILSALVVVFGIVIIFRILVAALIRFSLWHATSIATAAIEKQRPDVVLAFSWGGAIAWQAMAHGKWAGPTILLAPTTSAVSRVAGAASHTPSLPVGYASDVHVFHARNDPFCPDHQHTEMAEAGCTMHLHNDNHSLCGRQTVTEILKVLMAIDREQEFEGETSGMLI